MLKYYVVFVEVTGLMKYEFEFASQKISTERVNFCGFTPSKEAYYFEFP